MSSPEDRHSALPGPAEPLPREFDEGLREIDALLARQAASASVPRYLADAVYDATLGLFWSRQEPLRLPARTPRRTVFGRLAMAAAVALAFGVAAVSIRPPAEAAQPVAGLLPAEVERILMESPLSGDAADDYLFLLDVHDIGYEEINGDLDRLVEELEL